MKLRNIFLTALLAITAQGAWAEGELSGEFSVSASAKVVFSQGNLQATYDGSSWSWAFAANQWTYIGNAVANNCINGNGTVSANGTVDLFGWSTASTYYGIHNSTDASTYSGEFRDWGKNIGSAWRTLTNDEWVYLLNTRASGSTVGSTSNARYTWATIRIDATAVNGVILFPDGVNFESSEFTSLNYINSNTGATWGTWNTECTSEQWNALAAKGCVFLPAASGRKSEGTFYDVNTYGRYWSSTLYESDNSKAQGTYFYGSEIGTGSNYSLDNASSVRLVKYTPTYFSTFASGSGEEDGWSINPDEAPVGESVTVSYTGEHRVKSISVAGK